MSRINMNDLTAFVTVARERSFTRAGAQLGVSPSALSHSMRNLEERLGLRLLMRSTRSVGMTEAGERLLQSIGPMFDNIDTELAALGELRGRPAGNIRITADEYAVTSVLMPALQPFLLEHPEINVEVAIDYGLVDIVAGRFDAGLRLGGIVAKDMIAIPVGPEQRSVTVAAPAYFEHAPKPVTPEDLTAHQCINLRLPTHGGLYAWEFEKDGKEFKVRVQGQLVFNSVFPILEAALGGLGVAYLPFSLIGQHLSDGRLMQVLDDWTPPYLGYHLYYPSRRHNTSAFSAMIDALRRR